MVNTDTFVPCYGYYKIFYINYNLISKSSLLSDFCLCETVLSAYNFYSASVIFSTRLRYALIIGQVFL